MHAAAAIAIAGYAYIAGYIVDVATYMSLTDGRWCWTAGSTHDQPLNWASTSTYVYVHT